MSNDDVSLLEVISFVEKSYFTDDTEMNEAFNSSHLPVAVIITGVNKPDYHQYFKTMYDHLSKQKISHTAVLPARDCPNLKSTMETLISDVLSNGRKHNFICNDFTVIYMEIPHFA